VFAFSRDLQLQPPARAAAAAAGASGLDGEDESRMGSMYLSACSTHPLAADAEGWALLRHTLCRLGVSE
jgi:hypothetical protein